MIRIIYIAYFFMFFFSLTSCTPPSDNNFPGNIKIKDLAPISDNNSPQVNLLKTLNLDLQVLEIPEENFNKLGEIRRTLSIRPIKFNNFLAFSENSFSAYYGKNQTLRRVYDILKIAGAQNVTGTALLLPDGVSDDVPIKPLPQIQTVSYSSLKGSPEAARVGPGFIAMHIMVEKANSIDDAATVTILPIFTVTKKSSIPELSLREKLRDFPFTSAALQLNMTPGDFIVLAPERLITDQTTLCGLFFSNPSGSMFLNVDEHTLPERKPSIRLYILTCVGLNL
jgi:hypothetical protein